MRMKKVIAEDIVKYRIPGRLTYSPDGKALAFQVLQADLEKNDYQTNIWIVEDGHARQITFSRNSSIVFWDDPDTLIIQRKSGNALPGVTELFRLSLRGGEAEPWITLPFSLIQMKKLGNRYIATGTIQSADPDAYLDSDDTRKKKDEAKKQEKDYEILDEIPYWFNGEGITNGNRTALFLIQRNLDGLAVCKRLTAPDFNVDSQLCVFGENVYFTGGKRDKVQKLTNQLYVYHEKVTCLYRKKDFCFGTSFILNETLYFQATDMKAYGCNQTPDICTMKDGCIQKVYVPEVSLYSSVLGDTAEGGNGEFSDSYEHLTIATIEDHNAIFSFAEHENKLQCKTVWEKAGMLSGLDACSDRIAVVYQGWDHVAEVFEMNRDGSGMKQITHLNEEVLHGYYIAKPRRLDYESCGLHLHG